MGKTKDKTSSNPSPKSRPAIDPEARQNQLIALAVDCAERIPGGCDHLCAACWQPLPRGRIHNSGHPKQHSYN